MADWRHSHWYRQAEGKPPGYRFRTWHEDCTSQNHMQVSVSREGVAAYCHKCKEKMFVPAAALSLAEKAALRATQAASDKAISFGSGLPLPKVEDPAEWPLDARVWVYKAGVGNVEIINHGLYYHSRSNRVVIPVFDMGNYTNFWQARSVTGKPKYINPSRVDRSAIIAGWEGEDGAVILTEDWLSSYRVNRATGAISFGLLGTDLSGPIMARLLYMQDVVYVWLDSDTPGQKAAAKIIRRLQAFGVEVYNIVTDKDPKLLSDKELRDAFSLHRARRCSR